jgi:hypothetical protein
VSSDSVSTVSRVFTRSNHERYCATNAYACAYATEFFGCAFGCNLANLGFVEPTTSALSNLK